MRSFESRIAAASPINAEPSTLKMVADVGTKALDRRQFEFCRDVLNGYALAKSAGNTTATAAALVITLDELTGSSSAS